MGVIKGITSIIVLGFLILIIVGLANVGKTVNHDQATSNNVAANWSSIYVGETEDEVRSIIGEPNDVYTSTSSDFQGGTTKYDSWTYGTLADTTYSLDFIDGKLDSKSKL